MFAILWSLRKKGLAAGTITWLYLILAGLMRFIVEFWRINPSVGLGLSEAQWFSMAACRGRRDNVTSPVCEWGRLKQMALSKAQWWNLAMKTFNFHSFLSSYCTLGGVLAAFASCKQVQLISVEDHHPLGSNFEHDQSSDSQHKHADDALHCLTVAQSVRRVSCWSYETSLETARRFSDCRRLPNLRPFICLYNI